MNLARLSATRGGSAAAPRHDPAEQFRTFEAFWDHYLREHSKPLNRALHVGGTVAAFALAAAALVRRRPALLPVALLVGYAPAWFGHFVVEGNRPATLHNARWSMRADLKMTAMALSGRLAGELRRLGISRGASRRS